MSCYINYVMLMTFFGLNENKLPGVSTMMFVFFFLVMRLEILGVECMELFFFRCDFSEGWCGNFLQAGYI